MFYQGAEKPEGKESPPSRTRRRFPLFGRKISWDLSPEPQSGEGECLGVTIRARKSQRPQSRRQTIYKYPEARYSVIVPRPVTLYEKAIPAGT